MTNSTNRSSAVMAQRFEPRDGLDDFPTPPWATRALTEWLAAQGEDLHSVWEPAANRGHMVETLKETFGQVTGTDIHDYGAGFPVVDFLWAPPFLKDVLPVNGGVPQWIITNPPFNRAAAFARTALAMNRKTALLCRLQWLEGGQRYGELFSKWPPSEVLIFSERVGMAHGRLDRTIASATAFAWFIWRERVSDTLPRLHWIPPGARARLERPGDWR